MNPVSVAQATEKLSPTSTTGDVRRAALALKDLQNVGPELRQAVIDKTGIQMRQVSAILAHLIISEQRAVAEVLSEIRGIERFKMKGLPQDAKNYFHTSVQPLIRAFLVGSDLPQDHSEATFAEIQDSSFDELSRNMTEFVKLLGHDGDFTPLNSDECRSILKKAYAFMVSDSKPLQSEPAPKKSRKERKAAEELLRQESQRTVLARSVLKAAEAQGAGEGELSQQVVSALEAYYHYIVESVGPDMTVAGSTLLDVLARREKALVDVGTLTFPPEGYEETDVAKLVRDPSLERAIKNLSAKGMITPQKITFDPGQYIILDPLVRCHLLTGVHNGALTPEIVKKAADLVLDELQR